MLKIVLALTIILAGCSTISRSEDKLAVPKQTINVNNQEESIPQVTKVKATGTANNYTFAVTINSFDTGCDRYADWWEVVSPDGKLIYRRVLLHSHVDEQPFERTGGTVAIPSDQEVIVRLHMSPDGYSNYAQKGTVASGFTTVTLAQDFAQDLAVVEPLPQGCAF